MNRIITLLLMKQNYILELLYTSFQQMLICLQVINYTY